MNSLESLRETVQKQIEDELNEMEEDDRFWELNMFTGPFSFTNMCSQQLRKKWGGSRPGRSANLKRKREQGHQQLWEDYFQENSIYGDHNFRRRFRMSRRLFDRILVDVCAHDRYFVKKNDAAGFPGLSPHQKLTSAIRQLMSIAVWERALHWNHYTDFQGLSVLCMRRGGCKERCRESIWRPPS